MSGKLLSKWQNHEREFRVYENAFSKRSLRPDEYCKNIRGEPVIPRQGMERLQNEAACLEFLNNNTDIPVPQLIRTIQENDSFTLITECVRGRSIESLSAEDQAKVRQDVDRIVSKLQSFRANHAGGPTGIICPLPRINVSPDSVRKKPLQQELHFCHCDLGWENIFIDDHEPKVRAIIDWEYAGYWPKYFELPYYHHAGPSGALFKDEPVWGKMEEFFRQQGS